MKLGSRYRLRSFRVSLRIRVALSVALPLLLVLTLLSLVHYWNQRQLLEDQMELAVSRLGEVMLGSLRHAMLANDPEMLAQAANGMRRMETVQQVQVIGLDGRVWAGGDGEQVGKVWRLDNSGCVECHRFPEGSRPRATRLLASTGVLRICTPIANEPDCAGCHAPEGPYLGALLTDISVSDIEKRLRGYLQVDLAISIGSTMLVTLGLYLLIHWLVDRRVESFRRPLAAFAAGDLTTRVPVSSGLSDELDELASMFNHMVDERKRHIREQEERSALRRRAVTEERERIARELHDGLAQLLGYVNTKAMAVRLMLKNHQMEAADKHLLQLEEAARELYGDVREAIFDLRMAGEDDTVLSVRLKDLIARSSQLSGLSVKLALAPEVESLLLTGPTALQSLRIVQESLTNVRKHASASEVWVSVRISDGILELAVRDNGKGFAPDQVWANHQPHFGLSTMRERAEAIGAEFALDSKPGAGTCVIVRLPLEERAHTQLKES